MDGCKKSLNMKNAQNIFENEIKNYKSPFIIAVDAALSEKNVKNRVFIGRGNFKIGSSLGYDIECKSHIYLKGIVGKAGRTFEENKEILKNVNEDIIFKLATQITEKVCNIIEEIKIV